MWYHCNYLDMNAKSFTHSLCRSIFIIFICMILVPSNRNRVFLPMCIFETKSIWNMKMKFLSNVLNEIFKDLCHTNSSTIFRGFLFSYAYHFFKTSFDPILSQGRERMYRLGTWVGIDPPGQVSGLRARYEHHGGPKWI